MRFLHTADWHLGMSRRILSDEARPRFAEDRRTAVREIARIAQEEQVEFVVACGDVFDANHLDRAEVARAVEAMGAFTVPLFLLPGNHDPLDAGSVYRSRAFTAACPDHVRVIAEPGPIVLRPGVEIVGVPWRTRRPAGDQVAEVIAALPPAPGTTRVLAAHGIVDDDAIASGDDALIGHAALTCALDAGLVDYVALGDHHSTRQVGGDPRIRYPGTPEATRSDEQEAGGVLIVDIGHGDGGLAVRRLDVGTWSFRREAFDLRSAEDVERFAAALDSARDKERTVLRLDLAGSLSVAEDVRLHEVLDTRADLFASLTVSDRTYDVAVMAGDNDIAALGLAGYARTAADEIARVAAGGGDDAGAARDALRLLYRLAGGSA